MIDSSASELEHRFDAIGVSRRLLYPLWYRTLRAIGLRVPIPVTMSFAQHVWFLGLFNTIFVLLVVVPLWLIDFIPARGIVIVFVVSMTTTPLISWIRYRAIRSRLSL